MKSPLLTFLTVTFLCSSFIALGSSVQAHPAASSPPTRATALNTNINSTTHNASVVLTNALKSLNIGLQSTPNLSDLTPTQIHAVDANAAQQISLTLKNDWSTWTGGANNPLTFTEVGSLLANPKITGDQAVVLGMIWLQLSNYVTAVGVSGNTPTIIPSLTQAQVKQQVFGTNNNINAVFGSAGSAEFYFNQILGQIASSSTGYGTYKLYGNYSGPQLTAITQGELGDCFFLSSVESILQENPQLVSNMITQNKNGTFTVAFANGQSQTVAVTQGEIACSNLSTNNGVWLAVLAVAENQVLTGLSVSPIEEIRSNYPVNAPQTLSPLGVLGNGGSQTQGMNVMTGVPYAPLYSPTSGYSNQYSSDWTSQFLTTLLNTDVANSHLNSSEILKQPVGIDTSDHALAIFGWNPQSSMVTIKNPWGTTGCYGLCNGATIGSGFASPTFTTQMTNGLFTISLQTMMNDFGDEIVAPATLLQQTGTIVDVKRRDNAVPSPVVTAGRISTPSAVIAQPPLPTLASYLARSAPLYNPSLAASISLSNIAASVNLPLLPSSPDSAQQQHKLQANKVLTNSYSPATTTTPVARMIVDADATLVDTGEYCPDTSRGEEQ